MATVADPPAKLGERGPELKAVLPPPQIPTKIGNLALVSFKAAEYDAGKVEQTLRTNGFFDELNALPIIIAMRKTWYNGRIQDEAKAAMASLGAAIINNTETEHAPELFNPFSSANDNPDLQNLLSSYPYDGHIDNDPFFDNRPDQRVIALTNPQDARSLSRTSSQISGEPASNPEHVIFMRTDDCWNAIPLQPAELSIVPNS